MLDRPNFSGCCATMPQSGRDVDEVEEEEEEEEEDAEVPPPPGGALLWRPREGPPQCPCVDILDSADDDRRGSG